MDQDEVEQRPATSPKKRKSALLEKDGVTDPRSRAETPGDTKISQPEASNTIRKTKDNISTRPGNQSTPPLTPKRKRTINNDLKLKIPSSASPPGLSRGNEAISSSIAYLEQSQLADRQHEEGNTYSYKPVMWTMDRTISRPQDLPAVFPSCSMPLSAMQSFSADISLSMPSSATQSFSSDTYLSMPASTLHSFSSDTSGHDSSFLRDFAPYDPSQVVWTPPDLSTVEMNQHHAGAITGSFVQ